MSLLSSHVKPRGKINFACCRCCLRTVNRNNATIVVSCTTLTLLFGVYTSRAVIEAQQAHVRSTEGLVGYGIKQTVDTAVGVCQHDHKGVRLKWHSSGNQRTRSFQDTTKSNQNMPPADHMEQVLPICRQSSVFWTELQKKQQSLLS